MTRKEKSKVGQKKNVVGACQDVVCYVHRSKKKRYRQSEEKEHVDYCLEVETLCGYPPHPPLLRHFFSAPP